MFNSRGLLSLFVSLFFVGLISASPVPPKDARAAHYPSNLMRRENKVFLGYNGFNGTPRNPQASAGGELGAVFYIADAVDLAKSFAHGADPRKDYVCLVYADADAWGRQFKVWVAANAPHNNGMDAHYPNAVLFAPHVNIGLPGAPTNLYQMGIRTAQIARLQVTVDCHPKSYFATNHHTLNYDSMRTSWNIHPA